MTKLLIDGKEIDADPDMALIQVCEELGIEIPNFCYHERLSIAGNCRMCLVEVKGAPKLAASCAVAVKDLRPGPDGELPEVFTNTLSVKKAREGTMEFLLANHPLDCPICDQGGECDLQDQAMAYGIDKSRFKENKRAVEDKYIGPLIKTEMTRCIHCTRCVRFSTEIAGVEEIGTIGRGEDMEITTYLERALSSELQGNIIDLCPVGALTSRPYAFTARPWELCKTESIDVSDAMGCNIRVDSRGLEVMRLLPRNNDDINEEWISDKARFIWDGLRRQRLDQPYVRENGKLRPASWDQAFAAITEKIKATPADKIAALVGDLAGAEEIFALKNLMTKLGVKNLDCRQDGAHIDASPGRAAYIMNSTIAGIDEADAILLIGTNPRNEAAVLNARIRGTWKTGVPVALIGQPVDLTYAYEHLGAGPETLLELASGQGAFFETLKCAKRALIIIGQGALARSDAKQVLALTVKLAQDVGALTAGWSGFNMLHTAAARVAALDIGFLPGEGGRDLAGILQGSAAGDIEVIYSLGADEIDMSCLGDAFVIYQGTHGDKGAQRADVILPGAAYTEKSALYMNTEGRVQGTKRAIFPPGDAREDWTIIRALSAKLGHTLGFDDRAQLRAALFKAHPQFAEIDKISAGNIEDLRQLAEIGPIDARPFDNVIDDFYLTNPIARASQTMAQCSALRMELQNQGATGTHG